jgi:hypothetical protein
MLDRLAADRREIVEQRRIYLERPLGDRVVVDGYCGSVVPYRNVYLERDRE